MFLRFQPFYYEHVEITCYFLQTDLINANVLFTGLYKKYYFLQKIVFFSEAFVVFTLHMTKKNGIKKGQF